MRSASSDMYDRVWRNVCNKTGVEILALPFTSFVFLDNVISLGLQISLIESG